MNQVVKDVIKNGLIMFAVGALLAVAAPYLGDMVGLDNVRGSHSANPAWMGAFFGAFGAIHSAVLPLVNAVFGSKEDDKSANPSAEKEPSVSISIQQQPELAPEPCAAQYREQLAAQRSASADQVRIISL